LGHWGHSHSLFDEVTRVPLLLWSSEASDGRRVGAPVSLLDVAPTLLDLAALPVPASFDGRSLAPLVRGDTAAAGAAFENRAVFFENPVHGERGVRTATWTYIEGPGTGGSARRWLFLADDREQENDLASVHPEAVARLAGLVAARQARDRERSRGAETVPLDEGRIEDLEALGYLQ
jgi:arylsulfatase A-like enzyme